MIVGGLEGIFAIYDVASGSMLRSTEDPDGSIGSSMYIDWYASDRILTGGNYTGYTYELFILNPNNLSVTRLLSQDHNFKYYGLSEDNSIIWVLFTDDIAHSYSANSYSHLETFTVLDVVGDDLNMEAFDISPNGNVVALGADNDYLVIADYGNQNYRSTITGDWVGDMDYLAWSDDIRYFAGIESRGNLYIFDYNS